MQETNEIYYFGKFRLDASERRLWFDGEPVALTPKQFDLLLYFVKNTGRAAKKNDLLDAVWDDTYIEETTLARNVSWLRKKLSECAGGEPLIETVPKIGYRFTANVTRSPENENVLVIEEQTVRRIRGEEIIEFDGETIDQKEIGELKNAILPRPNAQPLRRSIFSFALLFVAVASFALVGSGFFLYRNKANFAKLPAGSSAGAASNRKAEKGRAQIEIGSIVHLQNRYPNDGSYLDAWGAVWSKPEFSQVPTQTMFVSTHDNPNRDNGSGSWEIVSASGKTSGEPLVVGDRIHLKNMYPDAGYLDACGWVEHLRVFENYADQSGAVFTTKSPNRDNGTGIWIVRSATWEDETPVLEGDSIAIESSYFINDAGKNRISGFLNVTGKVKDIPSFKDYDGSRLVFTRNVSYNQSIPDIWTITISKAVLK